MSAKRGSLIRSVLAGVLGSVFAITLLLLIALSGPISSQNASRVPASQNETLVPTTTNNYAAVGSTASTSTTSSASFGQGANANLGPLNGIRSSSQTISNLNSTAFAGILALISLVVAACLAFAVSRKSPLRSKEDQESELEVN